MKELLSSSPRRGGDSDCLQGKLGLKLHSKMIQNDLKSVGCPPGWSRIKPETKGKVHRMLFAKLKTLVPKPQFLCPNHSSRFLVSYQYHIIPCSFMFKLGTLAVEIKVDLAAGHLGLKESAKRLDMT